MIRLVTDSSCDLPPDLVERHRVGVVPLTIRFGPDEFVDRRDLGSAEFWMKLRTSSSLPETAAPSAGAFLDTYRRLADEGADGVVAVCLSSEISATYQSAVIGAEQSPIPVKVVDSRTVTMALGLQVLAGAAAAESGADLPAVTEVCLEAVGKTDVLAALDTLEFLKRGGRIGGAQAFIGGLLDLKPLISLDGGAVSAAGRVRTRGKAIAALAERIASVADRVEAVSVFHGDAPDVGVLVDRVAALAPGPILAELGPVVGTHSGPGIVGVAYRLR